MTFDVDPVGYVRMTQRSKWLKSPTMLRYHAYRDMIRLLAGDWKPGDVLGVRFFIAMPESWSGVKKAKMLGEPHQQRPDLSNLIKAFEDVFGEDKHIWRYSPAPFKVWAKEGRIEAT